MSEGDQPPALAKPDALLALHGITEELFGILGDWFDVADHVTLDLYDIDSAVRELGDSTMIAALAMRKLQALRLIATPGVRTSTDVVVTMIQDLDRALLQAPSMYLSETAAATDWDQALAEISDTGSTEAPGEGDESRSVHPAGSGAPPDGGGLDPRIARLQELHAALHEALYSVVNMSDGEIAYFE
jgi:hypothetical protein